MKVGAAGRHINLSSKDTIHMEGSSTSSNIKVFTSNNGKLVLLVVFDFKIITLISSTFACLSQGT
jgi:hypothetical protein